MKELQDKVGFGVCSMAQRTRFILVTSYLGCNYNTKIFRVDMSQEKYGNMPVVRHYQLAKQLKYQVIPISFGTRGRLLNPHIYIAKIFAKLVQCD